MKLFISLLFVLSFLLQGQMLPAQFSDKQRQLKILKRRFELNHFSPRPIDDSLSSVIFSSFLKRLDRRQSLFTNEEYKKLSAFRYQIDDELNAGELKFLELATKYFSQGIKRIDTITKAQLQKPFDFTADDKIIFYKEATASYATDIKELKTIWNKRLRYLMLINAYSIASADSTHPSLASVVLKNEKNIKEKVRKGQTRMLEELLDSATLDNKVKEFYFNAIATSFDPHSSYFSPTENAMFQSELSTEEDTYGFEIDEEQYGKIMVASLIPGGPAWRSGEINKNDELLQLQWQGTAPVEVAILDAEEVEEMLTAADHNEITITVKKQDGTIRTVSLRKEKIEKEQDVVKGYLLSGEKKIGYLRLPDFYTTWVDENGSGCANDMARELILMKKENLEGLILDLRYNGGGSMYEALQLCGIFIDEGPLAGSKRKEGKLVFEKDPNRGTIYDGPMLVMVNNQSASASELVAAALQDYNRAVILGSTTYGKATIQQVIPIDSSSLQPGKNAEDGFVKITTGKLYRISGKTAQCNGVIPDIVLPDVFDGLKYREKFMPQVLVADTVKKNNYYKPLAPLPIAQLASASAERVNNNPDFQQIKQEIKINLAEEAITKTIVSLKPEGFEKWIKENEALMKSPDDKGEKENKVFTPDNYKMEKERLKSNSYANELNMEALKNIKMDIYIQEAFRVMNDMIKLIK